MLLKKHKNKGDFIMEEESLQIRFEGEDSIDIETLRTSLNATVETLKSISDKVLGEDEFCKFKVRVFKEGSFIVDIIKVIYDNRETIFDASITALMALDAILNIRQHLKGNKPTSISEKDRETTIVNNYGEVLMVDTAVFNIYKDDKKIENNLAKMCDVVSKEEGRGGIEFKFKDNTVKYNKEDINVLSKPFDVDQLDDNTREEINDIILTVHKPDLIGSAKWDFYMQNLPISADILDMEFKQKFKSQKILYASNTRMKVQLRIRYKVNNLGLPDSSKKATYSILKVYQIDVDGVLTDIDDL